MPVNLSHWLQQHVEPHKRWLRIAAAFCVLALTLLMSFKVASLALLFLPEQPVEPISQVQQTSRATDSTSENQTLSTRFAEAHLFGEFSPEPITENTAEDAPETRLKLELLGVWVVSVPELSTAVITEQGKNNQQVYGVGDTLPGNAQLKQILADRVLIERQGQLETLRFEEREASVFNDEQAERDRGEIQVGSRGIDLLRQANIQRRAQSDPQLSSRFESLGQLAPQQLMRHVEQQLEENPSGFMNDIGLTPSAEGGYEVSTVVPAEIAQSYGLQPGDRIISVNGKPVGNPSEDVQIIQEIKTSKEATVQIQRGNQLTTVSIPIVF